MAFVDCAEYRLYYRFRRAPTTPCLLRRVRVQRVNGSESGITIMLKGTDNLTPAVCEPKARILTYLVPERDPTYIGPQVLRVGIQTKTTSSYSTTASRPRTASTTRKKPASNARAPRYAPNKNNNNKKRNPIFILYPSRPTNASQIRCSN